MTTESDSSRLRVTSVLRENRQRAVTDDEWKVWRDEVDAFGELDVARRIEEARRRVESLGAAEDPLDADFVAFAWARSLIVANQAAEIQEVRVFRDQHLNGDLIAPEDVGAWVQRRAAAEGPPTRFGRYKIGPDGPEGDPVSFHTDVLTYISGAGAATQSIGVKTGGALDALRQVAEAVIRQVPWTSGQAASFVLTGATPIVSLLRLTAPIHPDARQSRRCQLDIDADTPPEFVVDAVRQFRAKVLGPKARRPSSKSVGLVILAEETGQSGRALMRTWNELHPDERFIDHRQCSQSLRDARRRVAGVPKGRR